MKINRRYHLRRKGVGKGKVRRNPNRYKSIKCSYNHCPNEAVGYYATNYSGLWLCKNHAGSSVPRTKVSDIKGNPNHPNHWQLRDNFKDGVYIKPVPKYAYKGRASVKAYIDKKIKKAVYPYAVSSVEGNMYLGSLSQELKRKFGSISDNERGYAEFRFWRFQGYTNWSGD